MNSDEIVNKFIKCQTEKQIERTYYIFLDCKKDLIYDIEYVLNLHNILWFKVHTTLWHLIFEELFNKTESIELDLKLIFSTF